MEESCSGTGGFESVACELPFDGAILVVLGEYSLDEVKVSGFGDQKVHEGIAILFLHALLV